MKLPAWLGGLVGPPDPINTRCHCSSYQNVSDHWGVSNQQVRIGLQKTLAAGHIYLYIVSGSFWSPSRNTGYIGAQGMEMNKKQGWRAYRRKPQGGRVTRKEVDNCVHYLWKMGIFWRPTKRLVQINRLVTC